MINLLKIILQVARNVSFSQSRSARIMTDRSNFIFNNGNLHQFNIICLFIYLYSVVPVIDSSNLISMTRKPEPVFYEHHHKDVTVTMILFPKFHDFVMPLNSTQLPGQSLLWNHSENDVSIKIVSNILFFYRVYNIT